MFNHFAAPSESMQGTCMPVRIRRDSRVWRARRLDSLDELSAHISSLHAQLCPVNLIVRLILLAGRGVLREAIAVEIITVEPLGHGLSLALQLVARRACRRGGAGLLGGVVQAVAHGAVAVEELETETRRPRRSRRPRRRCRP